VILDGFPQLFRRILRVPESLARHPGVRVRAQVDVRVAQEREDRMIERRRGELHLAPCRGGGVLRDHLAQDLELHLAQQRLVLLLEVPSFLNEPADPRIALEV
jgi:hypothetical protein